MPTDRTHASGVGGGWAAQHGGASEESKKYLKEVERRDIEMVRQCLTPTGDACLLEGSCVTNAHHLP